MAKPTDTKFGRSFKAEQFRNAITSSMEMGLADAEEERIAFVWDGAKTYEYGGDVPYDLTDQPLSTQVEPDEVYVTCAVEFIPRSGAGIGNAFGDLQDPRVVVTVLDVVYPSVATANAVKINGVRYEIDYLGPPVGLFDVTIYQFYCSALDEAS